MVIEKKKEPNTHSKAKQRWHKAIHFVIIRIEVARTTAMLDALDARKSNTQTLTYCLLFLLLF